MAESLELPTAPTPTSAVPICIAGALGIPLTITDPELRAELEVKPEGRARHEYALDALKIGALALRHAQGRIDADRIRAEGDRLLADLGRVLEDHERALSEQVAGSLKDYFDPASGRFNERIERLIRRDGELEQLLRRQVGADGSELARTLATHMGEHSPAMKLLDPGAPDGLLTSLSSAVEGTL